MTYDEFLEATDEAEVIGYIKMKQTPMQLFFEGLLMHILVDHKAHLAVANGLTDDIDLGDIDHAEDLLKRANPQGEYNDLGLIESYDINHHKEDGAYTLENESAYIVFYVL